MIDEILGEIFGEAALHSLTRSRRVQLIARVFFGLLGAALGATGAVYVAVRPDAPANAAMHASMIASFVFLSCFSLFNVALARTWRWPGRLFVAAFVLIFVTRIVLGP
jgi:hypothetical protein